MVTTLLRTKLYIPRSGPVLIPRTTLVQRLNDGVNRDLSLVVAPVGYGKTTLVAEWVRQLRHPVAWLSLDRGDNDLATFLSYAIAAIQTVFPQACPDLRGLLRSPMLPPPMQMARVWGNEIDDLPQQLVLVLDDYHQVSNPEIHQLIDELLQHPPLQLHLLLATRTEPPLAIGRLRANRRINELRMQDLRFLLQEAGELFDETLGERPPERLLDVMFQRTEGWPAGLHLAALSLRTATNNTAFLDGLSQGTNRFIMDYLFEQVLEQQTPEVRRFLLQTSILDRLTQPLASAITDPGGLQPPVTLERLAEAGLFLNSVAAGGEWYRYHALFRELLRHQLQQEFTKAEIAGLHQAASHWLCTNGYYDEALDHALAAGDEEGAVQIVVNNLVRWLEREEWRIIDRRLSRFAPATIERYPWLMVAKAIMLQLQFRWNALQLLLEQAETRVAALDGELPPGERRLLRGYLDALWAVHYSFLTDAQQTKHRARSALLVIPPDHFHIQGVLQTALTMALQTSGEAQGAEDLLQAMIERVTTAGIDGRAALRPLMCLMSLVFAEGYVVRARELAAVLLARAQEYGAKDLELWAHLALGAAAYEANDLDRAIYHFALGAEQRFGGHTRGVHECLIGLVLTYAAQERMAEARGEMAVLIDFHREILNHALTAEGASLYRRLGLSGAQPVNGDVWSQGVSPNTAMWFGWRVIAAETEVGLALRDPAADLVATETLLNRLLKTAALLHKPHREAALLAQQAILYERTGRHALALHSLQQALDIGESRGLVRSFVDLSPQITPLLSALAPGSAYAAELLVACKADVAQTPSTVTSPASPVPELTRREREVLELLARRLTDREVAEALVISPLTVRTHIENLSGKLDAKGRRAIVARAREYGLLP